MTTVTKPYQDFVNNIDVVDAIKINAQYNALYNFLNSTNIDFTNLAAAIYSMNSVPSTLVERDASQNIAYNFSKSGQNPNLIFNPSAPLGLTGWTVTNSGGSTWSAQFGKNAEGSYFSSGNVTNGVPILTSFKFPVTVGNSIALGFEIFTVGVTVGSQTCDIQFYDNVGAPLSALGRVATVNGINWTKYSNTVIVPAGAVTAAVRCFGDSGFTTTNSAWRKIKVEAGAVATTFSDDSTVNTSQYGNILPLVQSVSGGNKQQSGISFVTTVLNAWATTNVTFPTAFSNNSVYIVPGFAQGQHRQHIAITNQTATGFTMNVYDLDVAVACGVFWIAIGS